MCDWVNDFLGSASKTELLLGFIFYSFHCEYKTALLQGFPSLKDIQLNPTLKTPTASVVKDIILKNVMNKE